MRLSRVLIAELLRRKGEAALSVATVIVGVASAVGVYTVTEAGKERITEQVHGLGANLIVLPDSVQVSDYYTADFGEATLPEQYVARLCMSELNEKVHNMIPKLSRSIRLQEQDAILTGILPQSELPEAPAWKSAQLGREHVGMDRGGPPEPSESDADRPLAVTAGSVGKRTPRMTVEELGRHEVLVGSDLGRELGTSVGAPLEILGQKFFVANVLAETGTIDDLRVFAHLHTVQALLNTGPVVNAIEIVGCGCHVDVDELAESIEALLPGTQATTIRQIAEAQDNTIRIVRRFSVGLGAVLLVLGGMSIGNYISANVLQRQREIGTLMALGARPRQVLWLFVCKAALLGAAGGALGFGIGTAAAVWLGPMLVGAQVHALPGLWLASTALACVLSLGFCITPCLRAARMEPATALRER